MKTFDVFRLSVLNLYRRISRTMLTVIGVVIGSACIIIMVSIGLTNLAQFDEMLDGAELKRIEVYSSHMDNANTVKLNEMATVAFNNIDNVDYIVPQKRMNFYAEVEGYYAPCFSVIAIPPEYLDKVAEIENGVNINPNSSMVQLVMGEGSYRNFIKSEDDYKRGYEGPNLDWMSSQIELFLGGIQAKKDVNIPSSRMYRANVVGILKNKEENYKSHEVYMSLDAADRILKENYKLVNAMSLNANEYDNVFVYVKDMDYVQEVLNKIRSYGFEAHSNTEWIDEMKKQQQAQQGQLLAIGLISLIISAIGIANTMMTGIIERKKEIGVMKVIGVSIPKIRTMFLIESAIIGAVGGFIGSLIAHIFGYMVISGGEEVNFLGMYFQSGMKFIIPIWLDLGAISIAIVVGVIAGFLPARRATMLSPLEAVRG